MEATVEAVSKFGFLVDGVWYNPDKNSDISFKGINKGTKIDFTANGKYVKQISILGSGEANMTNTSVSPVADTDRDARITRGNAINGGFAAFFAAHSTDRSHEEALTMALEDCNVLVEYISKGLTVSGK